MHHVHWKQSGQNYFRRESFHKKGEIHPIKLPITVGIIRDSDMNKESNKLRAIRKRPIVLFRSKNEIPGA